MEPDHQIKIISCRICRESTSLKKVTFEFDSEWSRLFKFCFGLQVTQSGPKAFCESCSDKLCDYGEFKQLCLQSDQVWTSLANIPKCSLVKEENVGHTVDIDHDHHDDYDEVLPVKEDNDEKINKKYKKIKDELVEINIEKVENPRVKDKEFAFLGEKKQNLQNKNSRNTKCYKYGEKGEKRDFQKKRSKVIATQEATEFYCGICDFTSTSSVQVNQHIVQHCLDNVLNCKLCSFVGRDVADMVYHRYTHYPKVEKQRYVCPLCSQRFLVDLKLQYHYRFVHLNKIGGLCRICGKSIKAYKKWRCHEKEHGATNYVCDHCGKGFLQRHKLILHMSTHYNILKFICDFCGKGFRTLGNLKFHISCHHTELKQATCTVCNRKYKNDLLLKKHVHEAHSLRRRQKNHFCEACSKGFEAKKTLQEHIFYHHTNEKPFACDLCAARYRSKMFLKIHKRTHTGELPYKCEECGKGFSNATACKRHQSVHTGVRPVKCLYCDRTFHFKKRMILHCSSKHKDVLKDGVELST